MTKFEIEEKIVAMLKTVYDPEIPVNVYDLGLIYKIGGYPPKDREHRRCGLGHHQPGLRTRMGQGHDERGG